jgi:predicted exporter
MTLLGETLDYPTYLFSHRRAGETVEGTLRQLWPTLRLCAATTLLGCLAMIAPNFPGLSQLGVFTIAGILAAVATTRWLLPALLPPTWTPPRPASAPGRIDELLRTATDVWRWRSAPADLLLLAVLIVRAPPLWENDIAALSPVPRALLRAGSGVARRPGRAGSRPSDRHHRARRGNRAAPWRNRIAAWLEARQAEGVLDGHDGPMRYLPSQQTCNGNGWRCCQTPEPLEAQPGHRHSGRIAVQGRACFAPFLDAVAAARDCAAAAARGLCATPCLARGSMPCCWPARRGWTALLPLSGVRDARALIADLPQATDSQAHYLDLRVETNRLVADFRDTALIRFGWGAALIVAAVWVGLRSWRRVAAALLPVLLALVVVVAALLALGERLSLFHLVSLLLVLGIGVDYGLFFSRPGTDPAARRRTLHALLVCCGSALTVFILLSTSTLPALHAIGLTVSLGVVASFVAALTLARPLLTRMS